MLNYKLDSEVKVDSEFDLENDFSSIGVDVFKIIYSSSTNTFPAHLDNNGSCH